MRRREDRTITKHTLNLFAGDYARLQSLYGSRVGAAKVIRDIVRAHLRKIEEDAAQKIQLVDDLDVDITDQEESCEHGLQRSLCGKCSIYLEVK